MKGEFYHAGKLVAFIVVVDVVFCFMVGNQYFPAGELDIIDDFFGLFSDEGVYRPVPRGGV